jgi:hypothetical protein
MSRAAAPANYLLFDFTFSSQATGTPVRLSHAAPALSTSEGFGLAAGRAGGGGDGAMLWVWLGLGG